MLKALTFALITTFVLHGCSSDSDDDSGSDGFDLSDLRSYNSDSAYADVLGFCAAAFLDGIECKLGALPPLLVDSSDTPTVDEIMERVVVSHSWMGDNFRAALERMPVEIRAMSKPLTGIVIDDDIRPSFFRASSGMIYLDPRYLWLNAEQFDTISTVEDYRNAYAAQMRTIPAGRYLNGNDYAYASNVSESRTEDDVVLSLARLLFHELAHANDFIETDRLPSLSQELGFSALINDDGGQMSSRVQAASPLTSATMLNYAAALYKGESASSYIQNLSGSEAGSHFVTEGANTSYSYSTRFEDFAMLVEETMMLRHFGIRRDVGFVHKVWVGQNEEGVDLYDGIVQWGQRGRLADPRVKPRAKQAMLELFPDADWDNFFDNLATPTPLVKDVSWYDNLDPTTAGDDASNADARMETLVTREDDFQDPHH